MNGSEFFVFPAVHTRIVFGFGTIYRIPDEVKNLKTHKAVIITDAGLMKTGIPEKVRKILAEGGVDSDVYSDIPQDSSTTHILKAAQLVKSSGAGCVIGLGGGSSLDAAKAVAIQAVTERPISDFAGLDKVDFSPLSVIAVPTTAGTGSEVSFWSVMTNDETHEKMAVGGEKVFPATALCDPELTLDLPSFITATTGMDALTHAVESFVNTSYQPISEALTLRAIELIGGALERAVTDGSDRQARYDMMLGSTLAGLGMNPTRLGLVHALAMPLGSWDIKIPHGAANAVLLAPSMAFNAETAPEVYARVALALGVEPVGSPGETAAAGVEKVREMARRCGIPEGLGSLGLKEYQISKVCEIAMKSGNIPVNPRQVTREDLETICRQAL